MKRWFNKEKPGELRNNLIDHLSSESQIDPQYYSIAFTKSAENAIYFAKNTKKTNKKVGLGVLGAGNFATAVMLPAISKIAEIERVAITSGSGVSAAHAAKKFGFDYAASQLDDLLTDESINTLAILTRHNLHALQTLAALRAML